MVEETRSESETVRYGEYIGELREFFTSRGVRFGQPADVVPFAARLLEPESFGDEMGSMLRSILYREEERLAREDLLMLMTLAVSESPLDPEMPGLEGALRQMFRFVTAALQQRGSLMTAELAEEPAPGEASTGDRAPTAYEASAAYGGSTLTAGDILAAASAAASEPPPASAREVPGPMPTSTGAANVQPDADRPGQDVLFRAVTMSAQEAAAPVSAPSPTPAVRGRARRSRSGGKAWLLPAGAFAAAAGVLFYLLWPTLAHHTGASQAGPETVPALAAAAAAPKAAALDAGMCAAPPDAGVSRVGLEERSTWAHSLMDQKLYTAAMPQLQAIAAVDPGFPGIRLDEADALLHMNKPDEARAAVDRQIGISACLAKLPDAALDAYCAQQFPAATVSTCRPSLIHIRQAAELQAALVHLELGHQVDGDDGSAAAMAELTQGQAPAAAPGRAARKQGASRATAPKAKPPVAEPPDPAVSPTQ